jgi:hypothetical protein
VHDPLLPVKTAGIPSLRTVSCVGAALTMHASVPVPVQTQEFDPATLQMPGIASSANVTVESVNSYLTVPPVQVQDHALLAARN